MYIYRINILLKFIKDILIKRKMDNPTAGLQPNPDKLMNGKNLIVVFCNVIFFIVVQTLFFKFIASKQFNVVLADKVGIINELAKHDPFTSKQINKYLKSKAAKELEKKAKVQSEMREIKNRELIKKWIGPPLAGALILLLLSYLRMKVINPIGLVLIMYYYLLY